MEEEYSNSVSGNLSVKNISSKAQIFLPNFVKYKFDDKKRIKLALIGYG